MCIIDNVNERTPIKMKRQLTPEQQKSKRADEIACRISMSIALVFFIYAIITQR